jgi:uncharacterized protein YndB with AHSA1/START domain
VVVGRSFLSDRRWDFPVGREQLWDVVTAVEQYPRWWPWLRRFDPGDGFECSSRWSGIVVPPLPYVVRFRVQLEEVEPGDRVRATVGGDVKGWAELSLHDGADGASSARLRSDLAPTNPVLRQFAMVARPMVRWGHEWVLDQGQRQFVDRALERPDER